MFDPFRARRMEEVRAAIEVSLIYEREAESLRWYRPMQKRRNRLIAGRWRKIACMRMQDFWGIE